MPFGLILASAWMAGLFSAPHCAGMCGGIVAALSVGLPRDDRLSRARRWAVILSYNLGRVLTYTLAGGLFGGLGALAGQAAGLGGAGVTLAGGALLSGAVMLALGLYVLGWAPALRWLEEAGWRIWRWVEPWARRRLPITRPAGALLVGALWGLLPCGLVYGALVWALTQGAVLPGAALMAAFGAGTLPAMLTLGLASHWLTRLTRRTGLRRAAGGAMVLMGLYTMVSPWWPW